MDPDDYATIFSDELIKNKEQCVFNLTSYEPMTDNKGTLVKPQIESEFIEIKGMTAGNTTLLTNGGVWEPLFKDDALIINNKSRTKNILINIIESKNNVVLLSKSLSYSENKIFITAEYIGRRLKIAVIPVDASGHQGDAVIFPGNDTDISVARFKLPFWKRVNFFVRANIYNNDFSIPAEPVSGSRSDIGRCGYEEEKLQIPAGIDVEGVLLDLLKSNNNADYLTPHHIELFINQKNVLEFAVSNPSALPSGIIKWGTRDIRDSRKFLIPGAEASQEGFYKMADSCKIKDRASIVFEIKIDHILNKKYEKEWSGAEPVWEELILSSSNPF